MLQAAQAGKRPQSNADAAAAAAAASSSPGSPASSLADKASDFLASALARLLGSCPFTLPGTRYMITLCHLSFRTSLSISLTGPRTGSIDSCITSC